LRIMEILAHQLLNLSEISERLVIPLSTTVMHVNVLEDAGLLRTEMRPGERGLQKVCQRVYDTVLIDLPTGDTLPEQDLVEIEMPPGAYVDCDVAPTCGLATYQGLVGMRDDVTAFYEPKRVDAQLIWLHSGSITYRFPNRTPQQSTVESLW